MDWGMIPSVKLHFQAGFFRTLFKEDDIMTFWENYDRTGIP
jgi:hypothetical protein